MTQQTVFDFLEGNPKPIPARVTIARTTQSKYLTLAVVRRWRKRTRRTPQFFTYSKAEAPAVQSSIEEHSVFQDETGLIVLEGFSKAFVDRLVIPAGRYVIAETDGGELEAPPYRFRNRRDVLRYLSTELRLGYSLRALIKMDWSGMRGYEDYETFLRKAKLLEWDEEEVARQLEATATTEILIDLKKGVHQTLLELAGRYADRWIYTRTTELLTDLMHWKAYAAMGYEGRRIQQEMDLSWYKAKELEEAARMWSIDDLKVMADRILDYDLLVQRRGRLAAELFLLRAPVSVQRRQRKS